MPDESTIRKITRRCGPELIDNLNAELLTAAYQCGKVSLQQVRADTTVVEADVKYPTDSGLLTSATSRIASRLRRLTNAGVKVTYTDRPAPARAHQHSIGAWLRRRTDEAKVEVLTITRQLADLAEQSVAEATKALQHKGGSRRVRRMLDDLTVLVERTGKLIAQARCRVSGGQPDGATRLVSLHEPDARPISKGRLGKPVEVGYKAQVVDNADGIIIDHSVHIGNPSDTGLLRPAVERVACPVRKGAEIGDRRPRLLGLDHRSRLDDSGCQLSRDPAHRQAIEGARRDRTRRHVHHRGQMAHRMRRPDFAPQARLGLGSHPTARTRRRADLVRARRVRP